MIRLSFILIVRLINAIKITVKGTAVTIIIVLMKAFILTIIWVFSMLKNMINLMKIIKLTIKKQ